MSIDCANARGAAFVAPAQVIIADDHPPACAALTRTLRVAMPSVQGLTASSLSAVESAVAQHPDLDLALLDLHLPGARGFSALLLLRGRRPELPAIVISCNDHPVTIALARQFGAVGFHVAAVLHKLGCHTRTHAALLAQRSGDGGRAVRCAAQSRRCILDGNVAPVPEPLR
ncbi:MAG TPA: response regulator [Steroidobacteraceae bacterium]|jgi:DNA-binding NarL/FixJ family response regulator|nr:response regulator [Steroidobacteraceae bacterium]